MSASIAIDVSKGRVSHPNVSCGQLLEVSRLLEKCWSLCVLHRRPMRLQVDFRRGLALRGETLTLEVRRAGEGNPDEG